MIGGFSKSPSQPVPQHESYEEKYERWLEKHESLRRRNRTTCRHTGKHQTTERKKPEQSPRQKEFFRRRNLNTEETRKKQKVLSSSNREFVFSRSLEEISASTYPSCSANQTSWNNCNFQLCTKSKQRNFSKPFTYDNLSKRMFIVNVTKKCKGTQTINGSKAEKKNSVQQTDYGTAVLDKEIIQLSNYLNEALNRELMLKQKMVILQELLAMLLEAAEKSWKGQFNEDKLRCQLGVLESQLQICTKSYSKRGFKKILLEMEDQKQNYEQKVKESLQKLVEEKMQAEKLLQNAQRAQAVAEDDCFLWKDQLNTLQQDWGQLTDKHVEVQSKVHVLENKLQWSDTHNSQLQQALTDMENECATLYSRIDSLQEDKRITMECLSEVEGKLRSAERQNVLLEATVEHLQKQIIKVPNKVLVKTKQNIKSSDQEGEQDCSPEDQLQKRMSRFGTKERLCTDLSHELEILNEESHNCLAKLQQCPDEFQHFQSQPAQICYNHWVPVVMVIIATALVSFLSNFTP